MFGFKFNKNSITKIASCLPPLLIEALDKKDFYSVVEVKHVFDKEFADEHNLEYAFAMFCNESDFNALKSESVYTDLRSAISKKIFGSWPRFNFDSLLDFSRRSIMGGEGGGYSDGGGDGGCGGE